MVVVVVLLFGWRGAAAAPLGGCSPCFSALGSCRSSVPSRSSWRGHQQGASPPPSPQCSPSPGSCATDGGTRSRGPDRRLLHGFLFGLRRAAAATLPGFRPRFLGMAWGSASAFRFRPGRLMTITWAGGGPTPSALLPAQLGRHLDERFPGLFSRTLFTCTLCACALGLVVPTPLGASPTSASSWSFGRFGLLRWFLFLAGRSSLSRLP